MEHRRRQPFPRRYDSFQYRESYLDSHCSHAVSRPFIIHIAPHAQMIPKERKKERKLGDNKLITTYDWESQSVAAM